jgi:hypothetical protein
MVEGHRVGGGSFQAGPAHGGEDGKVRGSGQVFLAEGQAFFLGGLPRGCGSGWT